MIDYNSIFQDRNPLAKYYSDFKVEDRVLLTGHSHQAWPNFAKDGIMECYADAAHFVDDKWEMAFDKADFVRENIAKLLDDKKENIVLSSNTHELLIRFLSSLDLKKRNKIITTDGEFHTVRRQLDALDNNLIELVKVSRNNISDLSERIAGMIDDKTAAVIVSKVMYADSAIITNLNIIEEKCIEFGTFLLIDAYHAVNAIPISIINEGLTSSFILGGGYKYLQLGEGNCFMRIPPNYPNKPLITGWFSEFTAIADKKMPGKVLYGNNHWAFAGATYDPVSHYRAAKVFEFFQNMDLNPNLLRKISLGQIQVLNDQFDEYNFNPDIIYRDKRNIDDFGGFTVFKSNYAKFITDELRKRDIWVDYRDTNIRFGPAPYLSVSQLKSAIDNLFEVTHLII